MLFNIAYGCNFIQLYNITNDLYISNDEIVTLFWQFGLSGLPLFQHSLSYSRAISKTHYFR